MTGRAVLWAASLAAGLAAGAAAQAEAPRAIDLVANGDRFEPALIEVDEGERVVLRARAADGKGHGIAIKEMKVKAALPPTGEVVPIEIAADKAGHYTISCSVYCGRGHSRMRARLVVRRRHTEGATTR
jgi:cytochrome c oxidase subunit 2